MSEPCLCGDPECRRCFPSYSDSEEDCDCKDGAEEQCINILCPRK